VLATPSRKDQVHAGGVGFDRDFIRRLLPVVP
jgi:hypothetical protein